MLPRLCEVFECIGLIGKEIRSGSSAAPSLILYETISSTTLGAGAIRMGQQTALGVSNSR